MWLSKTELEQIYPEENGTGEKISHGTSDVMREKYRFDLNKCCWYMSVFRGRTAAAMDDVCAVTKAINGGETSLQDRELFTARIRKVLL